MNSKSLVLILTLLFILGLTISFPSQAYAQTPSGDLTQVNNFIKSLIQAIASLAGLIATGFFVLGGFSYITSSGNPVALEKAKRTLVYASFGLIITIGAFTLSGLISNLANQAFGG
ncbi:MAG: pilin [Candidatus Saccharibacteria bacterium]|nr:pilin [Candidatus Saccharibacteria bacterium]